MPRGRGASVSRDWRPALAVELGAPQNSATRAVVLGLLVLAVLAGGASAPSRAYAQGAPSLPSPGRGAGASERTGPETVAPREAEAEPSSWELMQLRIAELEERLESYESERFNEASPLTLNGYLDFGFFAPFGNNGVGWVRDVGNRQIPVLEGYGWAFMGDILGSPVNSRGEAADLGDSPGIDRFDSVDSDGAPGFIVNEFNLRLGFTLSDRAILRAGVNFMPRSASRDFAIGDFVEVDSAELEYVLTEDGGTSLFAGKILPVFGIEYKERKSDQRFGITPSLVARYTTGPQLGVKVRSKLFNQRLVLAASATNNTSTVEQFDFYREIDRNLSKILSGRISVSLPLPSYAGHRDHRLEVGVSGEWGAQDGDSRNDGELWLVGADLQYSNTNFALKAQVVTGEAPGASGEEVWALELRPSGYVELDWYALPRLGFLLRGGLRDAFVNLDIARAYVTHQARFTGGVRWNFNPRIVLKAEYLHNAELGETEAFDNDMLTSSLVLSY